MRVRIKFCGMTNHEDAQYAAQLGVDAIGLIFYKQSPRAVTITEAKSVVENLPPYISRVAIFVDPDESLVNEILQQISPHYLQFHGHESPDFCRSFGLPYIKAIHIKDEDISSSYEKNYPDACGFLFDAYQEGIPGGTGKVFDWNKLPKNLEKPMILSGGLDPLNVIQAIEQLHPYAVDVTSGIESRPRMKDKTKMKAFVDSVLKANKNLATTKS